MPVSEHGWAGRPYVGLPCDAVGCVGRADRSINTEAPKERKVPLKPVYAEQVANGEVPELVAYLLKPPTRAYRVQRYPWLGRDGEVRLRPDGTPRFYVQQQRSELPKGER